MHRKYKHDSRENVTDQRENYNRSVAEVSGIHRETGRNQQRSHSVGRSPHPGQNSRPDVHDEDSGVHDEDGCDGLL